MEIHEEVKIVLISDTHGRHNELDNDLPLGDIIVCAGDISSMGITYEIEDFLKWFDKTPYLHKILIAGNHDYGFEDYPKKLAETLENYPSVTYLEDTGIEIIGIKFWGSPYTPAFFDWAFNVERDKIKPHWDLIPEQTDILITHGPPYKHGDLTARIIPPWNDEVNVGCKELLKRVEEIKPKYHVFGHIHSGNGVTNNEYTAFINASVVNERYKYTYPPKVVTIKPIEWMQKSNMESTSVDSTPSTQDTKPL